MWARLILFSTFLTFASTLMFLIVIFQKLPNQKFEASFGLLATLAHQALDLLSTSPILSI